MTHKNNNTTSTRTRFLQEHNFHKNNFPNQQDNDTMNAEVSSEEEEEPRLELLPGDGIEEVYVTGIITQRRMYIKFEDLSDGTKQELLDRYAVNRHKELDTQEEQQDKFKREFRVDWIKWHDKHSKKAADKEYPDQWWYEEGNRPAMGNCSLCKAAGPNGIECKLHPGHKFGLLCARNDHAAHNPIFLARLCDADVWEPDWATVAEGEPDDEIKWAWPRNEWLFGFPGLSTDLQLLDMKVH